MYSGLFLDDLHIAGANKVKKRGAVDCALSDSKERPRPCKS